MITLLQHTTEWWAVEPPIQSRDTSTQVPVYQDTQPVEAPCEPELTETLISMTFGVSTRP